MSSLFTSGQVVDLMEEFKGRKDSAVEQAEGDATYVRTLLENERTVSRELKILLEKNAPKVHAQYKALNGFSPTYDKDRKKLGL